MGHQHKINAIRFCGSGEAIVTASADRSMKVWDISRTTYKQLVTLRHGSTPNCVDVGSDSFSAVSGHHDGGLRCWDLRTGDRTSDCKGVYNEFILSRARNVFNSHVLYLVLLHQTCTKAASLRYNFRPWMPPKY